MASNPIVESLDVIEDSRPGSLPAEKSMPVEEEFALQARHKALRNGVVQGRPYPAHRRYDTRFFELLAERKRRVYCTPRSVWWIRPTSGFFASRGPSQEHLPRAPCAGGSPSTSRLLAESRRPG